MAGKLKRFVVFAGDAYYASGGVLDMRGSHDSLDGALAWLREPSRAEDLENEYRWCHVLDIETDLIVAYTQGCHGGDCEDSSRLAPDAVNLRAGEKT